jgi:Mrp family chromosome partitioning ATPase
LLALLAAFVADHLDRGFQSAEEVEEVTGLASLGFTPIASAVAHGVAPLAYALENPKSAFAESLRTLAWSVNLSGGEDPPKKILVTSAEPQEGKTTVSVCLAQLQALARRKVLLIDADSRRPAVAAALAAPGGPGLTEVLAEQATFKQAVWKDERTGLDFLRAGRSPPDVPSILGSERMGELLESLAAR